MKKLLIAVLGLVIAGAAVYWFFFYSDREYAERILPENTAVYLYFRGVDQVEKEGSQTLLWKRIAGSKRKELYRYQLESLVRLTESVAGVDPRPLLAQFKRDVALAVVPVTGTTQSFSLIAYVKKEKETKEFLEMKLDPSLKRRFPDLKKNPVSYQGGEYYKYNSAKFTSNVSPCYAFVDHHLIVTSSEVGMKVLFDVKAKKLSALKKNDIFRDGKSEVHFNNGILFFLNAKSALEALKHRLPTTAQSFWPAFLKVSGAEALQGFTYHVGFEGEGFREEGYVSVDRKREGFAKAYMEQRPQKLSGLNFLPASSEAAGAGTIPDGMLVWKEIETQVQDVLSSSQFSQWRSMLELLGSYLNFNFERDLVDPIGKQFSFAYESTSASATMDQKRYFIALEMKKPDHFRSVIEKLILLGEERGFRRKAELYQGKTLQVLEVNAGGMNAVPALWMEGSWFYFGTDQNFVKQSIDAMKNKKNLPANPDYRKVTSGFPDEVNSTSYTNTQTTLQRYAALLQEHSNDADRRWIRQYGLIEEINDLSRSLFGSASYSIIEKDGIRYRAYSSIPTSLFLLQPVISAAMR